MLIALERKVEQVFLHCRPHLQSSRQQNIGTEAVTNVNHTVRLDIWESAQHGFVSQVWSGPCVGIRPTRRPLRLSRHIPDKC
jgi:hypothetical protein